MQDKKAHSTSKKWSWRKPKGKPKRPLSAYNIFYQEVRQQILEERNSSHDTVLGGIGFRKLTEVVAAKWKSLEPTLKRPYELKAREAKAQYLMDLSLWEKAQERLVEFDAQEGSPKSSALKPPHDGCKSKAVPSLISTLYDASHHSSKADGYHEESIGQMSTSASCPLATKLFLPKEPAVDALLASAFDLYSEYSLRSDQEFVPQPWEPDTPVECIARPVPMFSRFPNAWHNLEGNMFGERYRLASSSGIDIYEPLPFHNNGVEFSRVGNTECIAPTGSTSHVNYCERLLEERADVAGGTALDKLLNMLDNDENFS